MLIKFLKHGIGDPAKAAFYVIDDKDHLNRPRAGVEVLRGDPKTFAALAQSIPYKYRYTSAVIAWAPEDSPSREDISEVLDSFEQHAFAGLQPSQYHLTAVMHTEDSGAKHIHVLVPRMELETGKSLNIAPPGHLSYFDALRDYFNHKKQWARPDDPERANVIQVPKHVHLQNAAALRAGLKGRPKEHRINMIKDYVRQRIIKGLICDRNDMLEALAELGQITRKGENYISVQTGVNQVDRLKGPIFSENFKREDLAEDGRGQAADPTAEPTAERLSDEHRKIAKAHLNELEALRNKREEYHRKTYRKPDRSGTESTVAVESELRSQHSIAEPDERHQPAASRAGDGKKRADFSEKPIAQGAGNSTSPDGHNGVSSAPELGADQPAVVQYEKVTVVHYRFYGAELSFNSSTYRGEINGQYRIGRIEMGTDSLTAAGDFKPESPAGGEDAYRAVIEHNNQTAGELSRKTERADFAIRERIAEQKRLDQCLSKGIVERDSKSRLERFYAKLKACLIGATERALDLIGYSRPGQQASRKTARATFSNSIQARLDRLASFAKTRRVDRSHATERAEECARLASGFDEFSHGIKKVTDTVKKLKFPEKSLSDHIGALQASADITLYQAEQSALTADCHMKHMLKEMQKNPYSQQSRQGIDFGYIRWIEACAKDIKDHLRDLKKDDYVHVYGFIDTVTKYEEMMSLSHPRFYEKNSHFEIKKEVAKCLDDLKSCTEEMQFKKGFVWSKELEDNFGRSAPALEPVFRPAKPDCGPSFDL